MQNAQYIAHPRTSPCCTKTHLIFFTAWILDLNVKQNQLNIFFFSFAQETQYLLLPSQANKADREQLKAFLFLIPLF